MARILLIEPDTLLSATFRQALKAEGYVVDTSASAQAAICTADKSRPDVVILELQLVAHSGIEFLYEFRSYVDWMTIPVVVLTHVPPAEFSNARDILTGELGVKVYLYKPQTSLGRLIRSLNEVLTLSAIDATVPAV